MDELLERIKSEVISEMEQNLNGKDDSIKEFVLQIAGISAKTTELFLKKYLEETSSKNLEN